MVDTKVIQRIMEEIKEETEGTGSEMSTNEVLAKMIKLLEFNLKPNE